MPAITRAEYRIRTDRMGKGRRRSAISKIQSASRKKTASVRKRTYAQEWVGVISAPVTNMTPPLAENFSCAFSHS